MNSNLKTRLFQVTLGTVFLVVILALPAMAYSDTKTNEESIVELLILLEISKFYLYGLPFLGTLCIESFILSQRELIPYHKAFLITAVANVVYIFLSFFSFSCFFTPPGVSIPNLAIDFIGSAILAAMFLYFCEKTDYLKYLSKESFIFLSYRLFILYLCLILFLILQFIPGKFTFTFETINIILMILIIMFLYAGFLWLFLIYFVNFLVNFLIERPVIDKFLVLLVYLFFICLGFTQIFAFIVIINSPELIFRYPSMVGILLIRFIINFVIKGYAISLIFTKKSPSLADTVISMQVWSYPTIAIAYYLWSLQGFH
jgi:hypothetical protein